MVHETKQKGMIVLSYYSELKILWHELDYYKDVQADYEVDTVRSWLTRKGCMTF